MQKLRLGFAVFRERATDDEPYPVEKSAVVTALNLDGTVKLCVFDPDGSQFVIDRAKMIELKDDIGAHYEECFDEQPAGAKPSKPAPPLKDLQTGEELKEDKEKPEQTNPKPEKDRGKGSVPDEDEDESAPGVKLNPTDRPSTIPGKETIPSVTTPEKGAEHAGIK
jgi:hypothetical protein